MRVKLKEHSIISHNKTTSSIVKYFILSVLLVFSIFPFVWIWLTALKEPSELLDNIFGFPSSFNWQNFAQAWVKGRFGTYFKNSIIITVPTVMGVCLFSALAGYAFGKLKFIGRNFLFFLFLLGLMIPFQAIMVSLYYELRDLHILMTYWAAILPNVVASILVPRLSPISHSGSSSRPCSRVISRSGSITSATTSLN